MDRVDKVIALESGDLPHEEVIKLFQELIDDGSVWHMQGCYSSMANELIEAGYCHRKEDKQRGREEDKAHRGAC